MEMWNFALIISNGHFALAEYGHVVQKQRDYIIKKANILSFLGPSASFAIQQCVFAPCDRILQRALCLSPINRTRQISKC